MAELAARGSQVTASQLKRWRAARLLPTPRRTARGRGRGRTSDSYPEGTADRAAVIAQLVAEGTPLKQVALRLFVRGYDLDHDVIVTAVQPLLDGLRSVAVGQEDPADAVAQKIRPRVTNHAFGKAWIARAGTHGARRGSTVEDALVALSTLLLSEDEPSDNAIDALGIVTGATDPSELAGAISELSLSRIENALSQADGDDLRNALRLHRLLLSILAEVGEFQRVTGTHELPAGLTDLQADPDLFDIIGVLTMLTKLHGDANYEEKLRDFDSAVRTANAEIKKALADRESSLIDP